MSFSIVTGNPVSAAFSLAQRVFANTIAWRLLMQVALSDRLRSPCSSLMSSARSCATYQFHSARMSDGHYGEARGDNDPFEHMFPFVGLIW